MLNPCTSHAISRFVFFNKNDGQDDGVTWRSILYPYIRKNNKIVKWNKGCTNGAQSVVLSWRTKWLLRYLILKAEQDKV